MLEEVGRALTSIDPGGVGRVQAHGEIWTATAAEHVSAGDNVRVVDVKGLLLTVKRRSQTVDVSVEGHHRTVKRDRSRRNRGHSDARRHRDPRRSTC